MAENFITRSLQTHGDKYDYSKVNYVNAKTKVIIICKKHGEFLQRPDGHYAGKDGCIECNKKNKTTEIFIARVLKIHGNRYDYSKVNYTTSRNKVIIICRIHGEFEQTPDAHYKGSGCTKCTKIFSTEIFKEKAICYHEDRYDYSKVVYVNDNTKVIIICKKHGEFLQKPCKHWKGQGCKKCQFENLRYTKEIFIEKAIILHDNKYDYSKVEYVNLRNKIKITCKIHGVFLQNPTSHLRGTGCRNCAYTSKFIEKALKVHNNKYDYSKVNYTGSKNKITIICNIHGEFYQLPSYHLFGHNCPACRVYKNENECRNIIEELTGEKFIKERPNFLNKLEYDGYNHDLKLAFEYNGTQHYKYIPYFHENKKKFERQKENDKTKIELSHKNGIYLIIIPYWIENKEKFIANSYENYLLLNILSS